MLQRIRGVSEKEVEMEFRDIVAASMADKAVKTSMEEFEPLVLETMLLFFYLLLLVVLMLLQLRYLFMPLMAVFIAWKFGVSGEITYLPKWHAGVVVLWCCSSAFIFKPLHGLGDLWDG
ncbi:hypothetical protein Csa_008350 [Cucumis sativus]|uniref:Uncharacterized protein n=1 Tax=Cucumis sativus TaxID=3659 RepID=A0A0A0KSK7_CUCSA|nr:hypothetical protein Csa_008350 [Cucumis sativus]